MSHIVFVTGDVGGNVPPTLAIASELAARGHRITIAGLAPRDGRDPAGLRLRQLPSLARLDVTRAAGPLGHVPALTRLAIGRAVGRDVRHVLAEERPDAIVVDAVMLRALREAVRSGRPTAALFHSLGEFWARGMSSPGVNTMLRPAGLAPVRLLRQIGARLLPTDPGIDPAFGGASPIAFDWLGTTERGSARATRPPGSRRRVLVSLSSAWQRRQGDVYRRILEAVRPLDVDIVVTTGGVELDGTLEESANVRVLGRVPHAELMPDVDLVVGHGGHSTTMKTLAHGLPLLVLPLDPTSDQPLIGRTLQDRGLGLTLPRSASPEAIRDAARRILGDPGILAAAALAGERLRAQDGARRGADLVESLLTT